MTLDNRDYELRDTLKYGVFKESVSLLRKQLKILAFYHIFDPNFRPSRPFQTYFREIVNKAKFYKFGTDGQETPKG